MARIQAEMVGRALGRLHPKIQIDYVWIESAGDQISEGKLADHGGKGLFSKAVDEAVLSGQADLAVHSMKDVPADEDLPLAFAAVPRRADVRDCLIAPDGVNSLADLPVGAILGTSSPRRAAQVLRVRPDLKIDTIRGNVQTRLNKVLQPDGDPQFHATLLASAGLHRLNLQAYRTKPLGVDAMLPAACQGALALMCRPDDHVTLTRCLPLNEASASTACHAERAVVAGFGADCHSPIAVYAAPVDPELTRAERNADSHWFDLAVRILSPDGQTCLESSGRVKTKELRHLVKRVIADLKSQGADAVLEAAKAGLPASYAPQRHDPDQDPEPAAV